MPEPWVRFEDEHLLVVAKPSGVNTHRADVHAQDGMYEWVQRQRKPDALSVLHRLDKATSGLLVFGKTPLANRSLTAQLEGRTVDKRYELLVARDPERPSQQHCELPIDRAVHGRTLAQAAWTDFEQQAVGPAVERHAAHPRSGRMHQVRVHAEALGMPILGDEEHGGAAAARLFLHAAHLRFEHPSPDVGVMELDEPRPPSFDRLLTGPGSAVDPVLAAAVAHEARAALLDPVDTDAYLWIDRHHDGFPNVRVERLGQVALVLSYADEIAAMPARWIDAWNDTLGLAAIYEQPRRRDGGGAARLVSGQPHERFEVRELGCRYLIDLTASATSSGLFLDQRETRRELLASDLRDRTVLNVFAHTGSLSVAAAVAGAETLSLDLSKRYLDWAAENLRLNGLDPDDHDAIFGDALEWMERLAKRGRTFDLVLVDPPSTSTTRRRGGARWAVDRDLHSLVERGARLVAPGGQLFVSTNLRRMPWPRFVDHLRRGMAAAERPGTVDTRTLPLDHRSGPGDPPYLKAAWITLDGAPD